MCSIKESVVSDQIQFIQNTNEISVSHVGTDVIGKGVLFLRRLGSMIVEKLFNDWIRTHVVITERIVENPLTLANLPPRPGRILEAGSYGSLLALRLASIGYKVWAVDLRGYPFVHPNLIVACQDICALQFPDDFFDAVISISTIEHIGLGSYGDPLYENGDQLAFAELIRVLSPGGRIIISVPFGKAGRGSNYRVYDHDSLQKLTRYPQADIVALEFFMRVNDTTWIPVAEESLRECDSSKKPINGCALIVMNK